MPGITKSVSKTETGSRRNSSSASLPLLAVNTRSDSFSKILASGSTMPGSSSTTRMVGRACPSAGAACTRPPVASSVTFRNPVARTYYNLGAILDGEAMSYNYL